MEDYIAYLIMPLMLFVSAIIGFVEIYYRIKEHRFAIKNEKNRQRAGL